MSLMPISAIASVEAAMGPAAPSVPPSAATAAPTQSFASWLLRGVDQVNDKLTAADKMVTSFALDDNVPVHEVMFALDEAKGSLELMLQVRNKLLQSFQDFMSMQL